ncbi:TPA: hypothetical protein N0F65_003798 [Lagenidium giganteum]|uniref:Uncharacterized protein n=1 Tax=Lagenidium giganteum TaxID=4803 RepID=A0AAV2Z028_9STRA|nr:TPA: hypothetical protein N0F65_003798 [Lagenidium giganteum]
MATSLPSDPADSASAPPAPLCFTNADVSVAAPVADMLCGVSAAPPLPSPCDSIENDVVSSATFSFCTSTTLQFVLQFCSVAELEAMSLLDHELHDLCEIEWRARVLAKYGALRYRPRRWRTCYKLRSHFERKVVGGVSARVYLMNARGDTTFFTIAKGKSMMCSRERAVIYNRCERMFDLSLRINRSIQEISALIGMVSVDEARGLLNEHINLMASVASLRGSLLFESELFDVFPAPVLLDANSLLRGTFTFDDPSFLQTSALMMQVWASIDGRIYRPLAPPCTLDMGRQALRAVDTDGAEASEADALIAQVAAMLATITPEPDPKPYHSIKLHELSGMTIHIDDNTLRYKLQQNELCLNALVSNTYLLYLFNPMSFRPLDWTYACIVRIGGVTYELPVQREGVFLNTTTSALRIFLSYGKMPEAADDDGDGKGARGAEASEPLEIPCSASHQALHFELTATNRVSKETRQIAVQTSHFTLGDELASEQLESSKTTSVESTTSPDTSSAKRDGVASPTAVPKRVAGGVERHVHLPFDAMICYCFSEALRLQYVEFAIGFEPLLHQLGVATFMASNAVNS